MANPHVSSSFGDLLDPRFQKIFYETYPQLDSMIGQFYNVVPTNGRSDMRFSQVGTLPDWNAPVSRRRRHLRRKTTAARDTRAPQ